MTIAARKPRIVIYGTGQFGQYITRFAVQKGWPIVAAFNRAGAKVGQDLGRLAGIGDIGVIVQDSDTASYDNLEADIGVVTTVNRLTLNLPAYRRLMNAGLNVLCHGVESCYPYGNDPVIAAEIDALAKKNGVTFTGGGIWDMSRIWAGILLSGPCTEITSLFHKSITDTTRAGKAQMLLTGVGFTRAEFEEKILAPGPIYNSYKTIPEQVLAALGYSVTESRVHVEPVVFDAPLDCPLLERVIPAGECVGTRAVAEIDTREGVSARAEFEFRHFREGEVEYMSWAVEGKPRTSVRVEREDSAHATASSLFNRIPDVIAAPPGIVTISQLGPLKHTALIPGNR